MHKNKVEIYDQLLKDAEQEIPDYYYEVNQIVGLVMLTISGIIISSPNPIFYWFYSLPLVLGLLYRMWNRFPRSLKKLRLERKQIHNIYTEINKSDYLSPRLKDFEEKHFGYKSLITEHIIYTFGSFTYLMIGVLLIIVPEYGNYILN